MGPVLSPLSSSQQQSLYLSFFPLLPPSPSKPRNSFPANRQRTVPCSLQRLALRGKADKRAMNCEMASITDVATQSEPAVRLRHHWQLKSPTSFTFQGWTCQSLSCLALCDPMERVAIPISRGSPRPRDRTGVSCTAGRFFTIWALRG